MYSIVETAKANGLNVFQYLYMVLFYMPDYKNKPIGVEKLLLWSDFIKDCLIPGILYIITIMFDKDLPPFGYPVTRIFPK